MQPDEVKQFISLIEGDKYELPMLLALHSLRVSEILGLTWANIDTKNRVIRVRGAALFDQNNVFVHKPDNKTAASRRDVPIMIPRVCALVDSSEKAGEYAVVCNPNTIRQRIDKICANNGLPEVGTHGLRHSFCSLCFYLGLSEKTVMQLGGWSDYQTMRNIYQHLAKRELADSVSKLTNFFDS